MSELTEIVRNEEGRYTDELPKEQPKEGLFWLFPFILVGAALWGLLYGTLYDRHWSKSDSSAKSDTYVSQQISSSEHNINYIQPLYQQTSYDGSLDNQL